MHVQLVERGKHVAVGLGQRQPADRQRQRVGIEPHLLDGHGAFGQVRQAFEHLRFDDDRHEKEAD